MIQSGERQFLHKLQSEIKYMAKAVTVKSFNFQSLGGFPSALISLPAVSGDRDATVICMMTGMKPNDQ